MVIKFYTLAMWKKNYNLTRTLRVLYVYFACTSDVRHVQFMYIKETSCYKLFWEKYNWN